MPTNANSFNSRVTSEALEKKFREVFPAQGGAELIQDLYASGVIQPVIDFSTVAEGSVLPENLQTAWDFSTGSSQVVNTTSTLITNTGFWLIDVVACLNQNPTTSRQALMFIDDGASTKNIWGVTVPASNTITNFSLAEGKFVVFLRSGDSLKATSNSGGVILDIWYRQIADVNGNLVNPLGFTFS